MIAEKSKHIRFLENISSREFVHKITYCLSKGYGVSYKQQYGCYWPFSIKDDTTIVWFHDPEYIDSKDFVEAVNNLFANLTSKQTSKLKRKIVI